MLTLLKLPCSSFPDDHLTIAKVPSLGDGLGTIAVAAHDGVLEKRTLIHLNEANARKLFNWLGAYLHGA